MTHEKPDMIYVALNNDENVHCEFVANRKPIFTQSSMKYYLRPAPPDAGVDKALRLLRLAAHDYVRLNIKKELWPKLDAEMDGFEATIKAALSRTRTGVEQTEGGDRAHGSVWDTVHPILMKWFSPNYEMEKLRECGLEIQAAIRSQEITGGVDALKKLADTNFNWSEDCGGQLAYDEWVSHVAQNALGKESTLPPHGVDADAIRKAQTIIVRNAASLVQGLKHISSCRDDVPKFMPKGIPAKVFTMLEKEEERLNTIGRELKTAYDILGQATPQPAASEEKSLGPAMKRHTEFKETYPTREKSSEGETNENI